MEFGIPKVREKKIEKYENIGVLTFLPTGDRLGRKVVFNNKAIEMLGINEVDNNISFSFSGTDVYIVNTSGCGNCASLSVGKLSKSFSDKKHYNYIKKDIFNIDDSEELELILTETENEFHGRKVYLLSKFNLEENNVVTEVEFEEVEISLEDVEKASVISEETDSIIE